MKILSLEIENVKRIKALRVEPNENGLTIIGGNNGQGKTSVLDSIAFALGGEKYRPSNLAREGAIGEPHIKIETDDGFIIERKGKGASLSVIDKTGKKSGQKILDEIIGKYAIDLPKFMESSESEKAKMLLAHLGLGEALSVLDAKEQGLRNERLIVGRQRDTKRKVAEDMVYHNDAPAECVDVAELSQRLSTIIKDNAAYRKAVEDWERAGKARDAAKEALLEAERALSDAEYTMKIAPTLQDTTAIEQQIKDAESINNKVRENEKKASAVADADALDETYKDLTSEIEEIQENKVKLLSQAKLPLEGLDIRDGRLLLDGKNWDCISGSQQLVIACAIACAINPKCKFVLMDKLEQFDLKTLKEFNEWLIAHSLQVISTRVSTGSECSLIIDDGEAQEIIDEDY